MTPPSDIPQDPDAGRVVDPAVLADRRARRADAEDPLERAQRAERMVAALEERVADGEARLEAAQREHGALAATLERAEHELTAALQREFAEQRLRVEVEGEARTAVRELEEAVAELRTEQRGLTARAAELARELDATRARAEAARTDAEVLRLRGLAAATAEAEVVRLREELDQRVVVHATLSAQITELRSVLDAVRSRTESAEADARRQAASLADAEGERAVLRGDVARLEAELAEAAQLLAGREEELRALRVEADGLRAALTAAEAAAASSQARAASLATELADERRSRLALQELYDAERQRTATEHGALEGVLRAERDARAADAASLEERLAAAEAALAGAQELAAAERERVAAVEAERDARLALADEELGALRAHVADAEAGREALAGELAERERLEDEVREALVALRVELERVRRHEEGLVERDRALQGLVAGLDTTAAGLRAEFERELDALRTARDGELAEERRAFATELSAMEARLAELRTEADAAATTLREQLAAEQAARLAAEAELATRSEVPNPIYDTPRPGGPLPGPDHPALARPGAPGPAEGDAPPPVVVDLTRAMERLRVAGASAGPVLGRRPPAGAERPVAPGAAAPDAAAPVDADVEPDVAAEPERELAEEAGPAAAAEPEPVVEAEVEPVVENEPEPVVETAPGPGAGTEPKPATEAQPRPEPATTVATLRAELPPPPSRTKTASATAPTGSAAPGPIVLTPPTAPTTGGWFAGALRIMARLDAPTAERLFLAALAVQAQRVERSIAYVVELPATGRHLVRVTPGEGVVVARDDQGPAELTFTGSLGALLPLAAGGAPRRLADVRVRGRRWRVRRLLRAMAAPVGLPELRAAHARPRPGDLLALLCAGVPADAVRGADFGVAYVVTSAGRTSRTLVRAEPDGALTAIPEAPTVFRADATVTVDLDDLLALLDGSGTAEPEGDAAAVAQLGSWLRAVQGL